VFATKPALATGMITRAEVAAAGWLVVRIWEHEDPVEAAAAIEQLVRERTTPRSDRC
jgi:hypothetical protein